MGFFVCDRCGYVWNEDEHEGVCPRPEPVCDSEAFWLFNNAGKALDHSRTILNERNEAFEL